MTLTIEPVRFVGLLTGRIILTFPRSLVTAKNVVAAPFNRRVALDGDFSLCQAEPRQLSPVFYNDDKGNCAMCFNALCFVALLHGFIPAGATSFPVSLAFKNISACNAARVALEAKHDGAKLSCLDNAVHMGQLGQPGYPVIVTR